MFMRKYTEEQSGFMQGRYIRNNIRLVLDMIDYNHFIEDDSFILFIYFYKAFMVIHGFIFKVITLFGFGDMFLKAVKHCIVGVIVLSNLLMVPHKDLIFIVALGKDASLSLYFCSHSGFSIAFKKKSI